MNKLILLSLVTGSYLFAGAHGETDCSKNQSNTGQYNWVDSSDDDPSKADASRRRGKGHRGRRRGGSGLR